MEKIEELIEEYRKQIENNMKYIKGKWACEADRISDMRIGVVVLRKVVEDLHLLKSSLPNKATEEECTRLSKSLKDYGDLSDKVGTLGNLTGKTIDALIDHVKVNGLPTQQDKVVVPDLQFPQSVVDWLGEPLEEEKDELMAYLMQYHWNEDSAYDDTLPIEVGEYLAESLSNVVKLLRAIEGESYTVEKEQLYYIELPLEGKTVRYCDQFLNDPKSSFFSSAYTPKKLTGKQIKAIDERYWAFAVPVEEEAE